MYHCISPSYSILGTRKCFQHKTSNSSKLIVHSIKAKLIKVTGLAAIYTDIHIYLFVEDNPSTAFTWLDTLKLCSHFINQDAIVVLGQLSMVQAKMSL